MAKRLQKTSQGDSGAAVAIAEKERHMSEGSAGGTRPAPESGGIPQRTGKRGFFDVYKSGQGYHTRVGSGFVFGALVCWGAYALYEKLDLLNLQRTMQVFIPVGVIIALGLFGYRVLALNRKVCDFLIATEGEMKKVNWTSRAEIIGSTKVVIFMVLSMSAMLFVVDLFFMSIFGWAGVLKGTSLIDVLRETF